MGNIYLERRELIEGTSLSWDITRHICARMIPGIIIIVTDRPHVLLASVRKQWIKFTERVRRERASSIRMPRIKELTANVDYMEKLKFTIQPLNEENTYVLFTRSSELEYLGRTAHTVYIAPEVEFDFRFVERFVTKHGLIVVYGVGR